MVFFLLFPILFWLNLLNERANLNRFPKQCYVYSLKHFANKKWTATKRKKNTNSKTIPEATKEVIRSIRNRRRRRRKKKSKTFRSFGFHIPCVLCYERLLLYIDIYIYIAWVWACVWLCVCVWFSYAYKAINGNRNEAAKVRKDIDAIIKAILSLLLFFFLFAWFSFCFYVTASASLSLSSSFSLLCICSSFYPYICSTKPKTKKTHCHIRMSVDVYHISSFFFIIFVLFSCRLGIYC